MSELAFFDTHILLHADDSAYPGKKNRAIALVAEHFRQGTAVVSLQVLQEYFVAAPRKQTVAPETAQRKVEILARGRVVRFGASDVIAGIELHRLARISFWDALIVQAARSAGAAVLCSEDLPAGAMLAGCGW